MTDKHNVLVVDNELGTRESLRWLLKDNYRVHLSDNPVDALNRLGEEHFDVVLSDILMEPFDGLRLLKEIKSRDPRVQVVMLTAFPSEKTILTAMRHGAVDYLTKPFDAKQIEEVLGKALAKKLQEMVEERVVRNLKEEVEKATDGTMQSLMQALASKDVHTFAHSRRSAELFEMFALREGFTTAEAKMYKDMAMMHDIGKIGIRDSVLKKPDALTMEEYEEMKLHPSIGYHIVKHTGLPEEALDIVIHHQERYDGAGYPHGLAGNAIPLVVRAFGVVDAYDAMRGSRPYRQGMPKDEVLTELKRHAGTQFDPQLVRDFVHMME